MLPEENSAEFEIRQATARIRKAYEQRIARAGPKDAKRLGREMNAKISYEKLKIKVKHSFAHGRVSR